MSLAMPREQREAFLAETRIGIVSIGEQGRGPCTVPVWYQYEPGGLLGFCTGRTSTKAGLLEAGSRISFCVQTETAPYSYVSVEGPAEVGRADYETHIREMAVRYLGEEFGAAYLEQTHPDQGVSETILVTLTPERWWSVDYNRM
ncbi:MAG: pyridoxamine 5'-phosphate oxidase family protein [bacterium]